MAGAGTGGEARGRSTWRTVQGPLRSPGILPGHSAARRLAPDRPLGSSPPGPSPPWVRGVVPGAKGQVGLDWTHRGGGGVPGPSAKGALTAPSDPLCPGRADSGPLCLTYSHLPPPAWGLQSASADSTSWAPTPCWGSWEPTLGRLPFGSKSVSVCVCVCVSV